MMMSERIKTVEKEEREEAVFPLRLLRVSVISVLITMQTRFVFSTSPFLSRRN
jgi:hypothetical protein